MFCIVLSVGMLNVAFYLLFECNYAECQYAECRGTHRGTTKAYFDVNWGEEEK
jgi:hypothetical protein